VVTLVASDVTLKNATLNGEVTEEGYSATTERGFVFSDKNINPSVSDTKVQSGYGKGAYSIVLDKLPVNTKYYYKAYATNTKGTSYGVVQSFTTDDFKLAILNTGPPRKITYSTAELIASVVDEGGGTVLESGFVLSTKSSPTVNDLKFSVSKGKTEFSLVINNLSPNLKYFIRSYAINEKGIGYGNEQNFITLEAPPISEKLKEDLMAFYPFNGNTNDESNFKNNAKNYGATLTTDRFNNPNKAYFFNGDNNYITAIGTKRYAPTEFTLSYWIRYSSFNKISSATIALGNVSSNIWMVGGGEGGLGLSYGVGCTDGIFKSTTNKSYPITLNNWYHILVVFKSDRYFLYINNELIGLTYFNSKNTSFCSSSDLYFGLDIFGLPEYFLGKMDDIGIWARALSDDEIKYLYQNPFQVN
jgi:hypothetical protein